MSPKFLSVLLALACIGCFVGAWIFADDLPHRWIYLAGGGTAFGLSSGVIGFADVVAGMIRRRKQECEE